MLRHRAFLKRYTDKTSLINFIGRTMKRTFNYLVCSLALLVAIVFVLSGSLVWTLCGLAWCLMLYMWGVVYPKWWKMFWVSNLRILAHFNCL